MKMVPHQTVCIGVGYWLDVTRIQIDIKVVVPLLYKNILPIVATIEYVVITAWLERRRTWHDTSPMVETLKVFKTFRVLYHSFGKTMDCCP
jgi:hypothetical protein